MHVSELAMPKLPETFADCWVALRLDCADDLMPFAVASWMMALPILPAAPATQSLSVVQSLQVPRVIESVH